MLKDNYFSNYKLKMTNAITKKHHPQKDPVSIPQVVKMTTKKQHPLMMKSKQLNTNFKL